MTVPAGAVSEDMGVDVEISVTSAKAKAKAMAVLQRQGHRAVSGSVRLAYPFSIRVEDVAQREAESIRRLVASVDPGSGTIVLAADAVGSPRLTDTAQS